MTFRRTMFVIAAVAILQGCAVISTAVSVTGTVVSTAADVTGDVISATSRTITGSGDDDDKDEKR